MKRLALFLVGAFLVFELSYALGDRKMFFGSASPAPVSGTSDRPAVEAALAQLDAALVKYYASGDEAPLRAVLLDADGVGSPLQAWQLDRHIWLQSGGVPALSLLKRRLMSVSVFGLDTVTATAEESWEARVDGGRAGPRGGLVVHYGFQRSPQGLLVKSLAVEP